MLFTYPLDTAYIMKKSKSLKKQLLGDGTQRIKKKIAVLGGSTVDGIVDVLELFLLDYGIEPTFYKSEFGRYWQDAMFPPEELTELAPDLVFIHTSNRNISAYPEFSDGEAEVNAKLEGELERFSAMWRNSAVRLFRTTLKCRSTASSETARQPIYTAEFRS